MKLRNLKMFMTTGLCMFAANTWSYTQAEIQCSNERQLINQHGYKKGDLQKMSSADGERTFVVHKTALSSGEKYEQIVLLFHGAGGTGCIMRNSERIGAEFENREIAGKPVIYVYPSGLASDEYVNSDMYENFPLNQWNDGRDPKVSVDDVGFVRAILDKLKSESNTNIKNIFASGFSNGATFLHRLAAEVQEIDAIAPASGQIPKGYVDDYRKRTGDSKGYPFRPVHYFQISIVGDSMPFDGKESIYGAYESFDIMKQVNGVVNKDVKEWVIPSWNKDYKADDYADYVKWTYNKNLNKKGADIVEIDRRANSSKPEAGHCWHGISGEANGSGCTGMFSNTDNVIYMFEMYQNDFK